MIDPAPPAVPSPAGSRHRRRRGGRLVLLALMAACCLAVAVVAGTAAHSQLVRPPTAAQRAAAAAEAVADRWRSWPAGHIFPVTLTYSTSLLTTETARRVGISSGTSCAAAVQASLTALTAREKCAAGLRATYLDQLQGVLYTIGVLAFPGPRQAAAFAAGLRSAVGRRIALHALAFPGTASARFTAGARQSGTVRQNGPFVVLTAAGYADGEPAGRGQQARPSVFAPAGQLAAAIIRPLAQPVTVDCASPEWKC